ncbi:DMP19 family protein [Granulicella tundricola]|uniref:DNA mimic protein DMP19 C-terminal domain-containing protein n=1 Tax=Granulicella tundricola (strain ATCC BAA-1859 / DSM 23138 / MP5ACTX9) TaxID=1198114 RepID=E8WW67_GRATM|nr:DUF4375 domain-containing protein [Granulicella tundricola]ADW68450.1 hypothetical protein AciX9_1391 [Granulicella tundricola MP5ACTX9]
MENEQSYTVLMDTVWDDINIYDGPSAFLLSYASAAQPAGILCAAHFVQAEAVNGGFHQLFMNSSGILAPEAVFGFQELGMIKAAEAVEAAIKLLGTGYPLDLAERQQRLAQVPERYLAPLDQQFAEAIDTENGGFEKVANEFVKNLGKGA